MGCTQLACGVANLPTPAPPCTLNGGAVRPSGWSGKDGGSNSCNTCSCNSGVLACTRMFCGAFDLPTPSPSPATTTTTTTMAAATNPPAADTCKDFSGASCAGCLASNNVCYPDMSESHCGAWADYKWCPTVQGRHLQSCALNG